MTKSFAYRLFGAGRMPAEVLSGLRAEGLLAWEEGVRASVTYIGFRAPGRLYSWKRRGFSGCLALTRAQLLGLQGTRPVIQVPLGDPRLEAMQFGVERENVLCAAFEAGLFHKDWSGRVEVRFQLEEAPRFLSLLKQQQP